MFHVHRDNTHNMHCQYKYATLLLSVHNNNAAQNISKQLTKTHIFIFMERQMYADISKRCFK